MIDRSLLLIKPNAVQHHHVGHIISIVEEHGFQLRDIKIFQFTNASAEVFYEAHRGKEFFDRLIKFMCSGVTVALLLERNDAVEQLRELVGDADPTVRDPNSIRDRYADGITENAVHGSDSIEAAKREIRLIFGNSY